MTSSEPSGTGRGHKDQSCRQRQPCATLEQGHSKSRAALTLQQAEDASPACQEPVKGPALVALGPNLAPSAVNSLPLGSRQAACPPGSSSLPGFTGIHLRTSVTTAREHHTAGCCAAGPASSMRATASLSFFWGRRDCRVLQLWYCRVLQLWYVTYLISCPSLVRCAE